MDRFEREPVEFSGSPLADVFREAGVPPPTDPSLGIWPAVEPAPRADTSTGSTLATPPPLRTTVPPLLANTADVEPQAAPTPTVGELVAALELPDSLEALHPAVDQRPDVAWFVVTAEARTLAPSLDQSVRAASFEIDWTGPTTATIRSTSGLATLELMTPDIAATHREIAMLADRRPAVRITALR